MYKKDFTRSSIPIPVVPDVNLCFALNQARKVASLFHLCSSSLFVKKFSIPVYDAFESVDGAWARLIKPTCRYKLQIAIVNDTAQFSVSVDIPLL